MEKAYTAQRAQKSENRFLKGALVGGAIGLAAGGVGGYFVARKKLLKKAKEDCKKAYKKGYAKGEDDATKEAQEWIDENIVVVDSEKPEDIQKAIQEHEKESAKRAETAKQKDQEHELLVRNIRKLRLNGNHTVKEIAERLNISEALVLTILKELKIDPVATVEVISDHDKAAEIMNEAYVEAMVEKAGDPEDWDLSIDGDEAEVRSEEREKYLDMIDQYQHHPEEGPMHISRKDFEEECYLEKDWVTYYAGDNVFASDQDADSPMDGFANFGVVNGNDLFATRVIDDEENDDPNIVYIRNFGLNTVYEVTRTAGSYADLKSGDAFLYEKPTVDPPVE